MTRLKATLVAFVLLAAAPAIAMPRPGQPAPQVAAPLLDGGTFDLAKARGKVVVLSFWATWCAPCRTEMPILDAAARAHLGEGLQVVGLSVDRLKARPDVERVAAGVSYPSGLALEASVNGFGAPRALPQTFVIDRHGVVRATFGVFGEPVTATGLEAVLRPLLAQDSAR